jgi:site-specific recombinase XerD
MKNIEGLLDRYRLEAGAAGHTPKTMDNVVRPVRLFSEFVGDIEAQEVTVAIAKKFIVWLREKDVWSGTNHAKARKLSSTTVNTYVRALRSFWSFLLDARLIIQNPLAEVKPPKKGKTIPKTFSSEEMQLVFAQLQPGSREEVLVLLFLDSGIRLKELLQLPMKRLDLQEKRALVEGKGDKQRYVYFCPITENAIKAYIANERPHPASMDCLILSEKGLPLSTTRVQFIVAAIGKRAGLKERLSPHKLRHTFATMSLKYGSNMEYLKKLLGHSDIKTTSESYLNVDDRDVATGYAKSSPIANLNKKPELTQECGFAQGIKTTADEKKLGSSLGAEPLGLRDESHLGRVSSREEYSSGKEIRDAVQDLQNLSIMVGNIEIKAISVLLKMGEELSEGLTTGEFLTPFNVKMNLVGEEFKLVCAAGESLLRKLNLRQIIHKERRRGRTKLDVECWVLTELGNKVVLELQRKELG